MIDHFSWLIWSKVGFFPILYSLGPLWRNNETCLLPRLSQGAPETVLERCNYIRVSGSSRVPLSSAVREQLLSNVREWGSGRDMLRCLAMATRDTPPDIRSLNLENSAVFADYEVIMMKCSISFLKEWRTYRIFICPSPSMSPLPSPTWPLWAAWACWTPPGKRCWVRSECVDRLA